MREVRKAEEVGNVGDALGQMSSDCVLEALSWSGSAASVGAGVNVAIAGSIKNYAWTLHIISVIII